MMPSYVGQDIIYIIHLLVVDHISLTMTQGPDTLTMIQRRDIS